MAKYIVDVSDEQRRLIEGLTRSPVFSEKYMSEWVRSAYHEVVGQIIDKNKIASKEELMSID